ncbi:arginine deiminase-related protein [Spirosoma koreense]
MIQPAQITNHVLMIRSEHFGYNRETAESNTFLDQATEQSPVKLTLALMEFDRLVAQLQASGIQVTVARDTDGPVKPDGVYANNWVSFHPGGLHVLYPMQAPNRRAERRPEVIDQLVEGGRPTQSVIDLSYLEAEGQFLEGTCSVVLDRVNKIAYACQSVRTSREALQVFAQRMGYQTVLFHAFALDQPVFHTNIVMAIGEAFCVICLDAIPDVVERQTLVERLTRTGKQLLVISLDQMQQFAGNLLQVAGSQGERFIVLSNRAFRSLEPSQVAQLTRHGQLIHPDLSTIEAYGGGSARCLLTEVF